MTDPESSDDVQYTAENADSTQPPEALDDGGVCLTCGEQFPTLKELSDHATECGKDGDS